MRNKKHGLHFTLIRNRELYYESCDLKHPERKLAGLSEADLKQG